MFEKLFSYRAVVARHLNAPLAAERAGYLQELAAKGMAHATILHAAQYTLCVATELQAWPQGYRLSEEEVDALAAKWAAKRVSIGRSGGIKWPKQNLLCTAMEFLRKIDRLHLPVRTARPWEEKIAQFLAVQQERCWLSPATRNGAQWQIERFLLFLDTLGVRLKDITPQHVDSYFVHMAQRWNRESLRTSAKFLRAWFAHCEVTGWTRHGLAKAIVLPRIYRDEAIPLGPPWEEVTQIIGQMDSGEPPDLRDRAILLLLAIYGLRSGEVRRLSLDDIDWAKGQLRVVRSKSGRQEILPLEVTVGNAIALYLQRARPKSASRTVFLTLCAPHRPLSTGGLYNLVARHLAAISTPTKRGPHALRHACARHLLETGHNYKQIGDHLGHRSPDSTRTYTKVDLAGLRQVALDSLGGLS